MMNSPVINNMDVKRKNRIMVLRHLLEFGRVSQPELTQKLSLSWPTVLQNVKELTALGLVEEVGEYKSTGGRKAKAYAPVKDAYLAIGVDITQNHVGLVLVNLSGEVVRSTRKEMMFSLSEDYYRLLGSILEEFINPEEMEKILSVGISLPGIIDDTGERLLYSHALNIYDVNTNLFTKYITKPVSFLNDANAAGLAEVWGKATSKDLIYLSLSNSVGGAILNDNAIYNGTNLRAGEFGHMTLIPNGQQCYCGKSGCIDAYCSAKVLSQKADGNLMLFFEKLNRKEPHIEKAWEEYLEHLSIVINNLRMCFDCDVIAGGYVGAYLDEHGDYLKDLLSARNTFENDSSYFKTCHYKQEASAVGAALVQIEAFIQTIA